MTGNQPCGLLVMQEVSDSVQDVADGASTAQKLKIGLFIDDENYFNAKFMDR